MINGQSVDAVRRPGNASPAGMNGSTRPRPAFMPSGPAGTGARFGAGDRPAAAVRPRPVRTGQPDPAALDAAALDPRTATTMAAIARAAAQRAAGNGASPLDGVAGPQPADPGEMIEIEYEGRVYEIPAELRGAFLRQADYTRKTQGLARQRRALDQARAALSMQLMAQQEHIRDIAALVNLDEQLQAFAGTNWQLLRQQNPAGANAAFQRMLALTQARNQVATRLQEKLRARAALARQFGRGRKAAMEGALRRDIKGWNQSMARRLRDYGMSLGFDADELDAVTDPRIIKALHRAFVADEQRKAGAPQPAEGRGLRPLTQVARRSSPAEIELSDRMSTEDWIKARNAQIRQRKGIH